MKVDLTSLSLNLSADSNEVVNYRRDPQNYVTQLFGAQQLAISTGFLNVHMSQGVMVNPHWHTNVNELVVVITGEVIASVFNPFSQRLMTYRLKPGQVVQFPKGWFHWIVSLTDNTFIMAIFDQPTPDVVYASDFLRFLPKEIAERAYCVNPEEFAKAVAPISQSAILGPPVNCGNRETSPARTQPAQYISTSYPDLQPEQLLSNALSPYRTQQMYPYGADPNRFWW